MIYYINYFFILGSSASLSPSPNRLNARMIRLMIIAGKTILYGHVVMLSSASEVREPRLAMGADTPIPKKLKNASVKIAEGICSMTVAIS